MVNPGAIRDLLHPRRVLVLGEGPRALSTREQLRRRLRTTVRGPQEVSRGGAPQSEAELFGELQSGGVDEVYIAPENNGAELRQAVRACALVGVPYAIPTEFPLEPPLARDLCARGDDGYLHILHTPAKPVQRAIKRAMDIFGSLMGLLLLSPVLLGAALAVRLSSPGPILFIQERVGLRGRTLRLLKFRSMVANAESLQQHLLALNEQSGPVFKMRQDPRVTRVGRFMRRTSIDELPQLWNVLRGDLSLVGPRPPLASEVARYEPWQRRRLSAKPGLTCIWQVSGRSRIGFDEWMRMDLRYIDEWSLWLDIVLLLRTIPAVLLGRGAS